MKKKFVIGVDFGTDSVRGILVNALTGEILDSESADFKRWKDGLYCETSKNQFRQHPNDHFESLQAVINKLLHSNNIPKVEIRAMTIDTTGSSPIAVDRQGRPIALQPAFKDNPNAMVILWKDHTAIKEAEMINERSKSWGGEDFTKYSGGIYSSEWYWSKILHIAHNDPLVDKAAWTWMEHCDFIVFELTDQKNLEVFKRSRCAAGHKGMWHESWGGYPPSQFFEQLHPSLGRLRETLPNETFTADNVAGRLNEEWAEKLGLSKETIVTVGLLDAHACAVGSGIRENSLVKVMGTSTCDMLVNRPEQLGDKIIPGISGQVDGSILPGMIGFEAGQSAFGDALAWFKNVLSYGITQNEGDQLLQKLADDAEKSSLSEDDVIALDWINGRRTPDANQALMGVFSNLTIGTGAVQMFKGLVESICFGAKAINERFLDEGLKIEEIVGVGGVADKSPYVMQTLADVLQSSIKVSAAEQSGALGCAMYASVCAGIHNRMEEAVKVMGKGFKKVYEPDDRLADIYAKRYNSYRKLGSFVEDELSQK